MKRIYDIAGSRLVRVALMLALPVVALGSAAFGVDICLTSAASVDGCEMQHCEPLRRQ